MTEVAHSHMFAAHPTPPSKSLTVSNLELQMRATKENPHDDDDDDDDDDVVDDDDEIPKIDHK